jgi:phosphoserine aminotransferase
MNHRVFNYNAGPSALPLPVLKTAQKELVSFGNAGMSVLEMSHREKDFTEILARADNGLRSLLGIPSDYAVLFLGGGASLQFAMVPMNLAGPGKPVDLINTGTWSKKAAEEIAKTAQLRLAASTENEKFVRLPRPNEINLSPDAAYVHVCSNNTIEGTQWSSFPDTGGVPLVADMSSDILSRKIDVSRFGLIFAGAQKNLGPAGVTVVILRKDLAERASKNIPAILQYRTHLKEPSLYNTPPTFPIYMVALVAEWVKKEGGIAGMEKKNAAKAALLYSEIDRTGFYTCPVPPADRSKMNVVFRVKSGDEALEDKFVADAKKKGLVGLKGHRSVGGLRASIYNAQSLQAVKVLVSFMKDFEKKNG